MNSIRPVHLLVPILVALLLLVVPGQLKNRLQEAALPQCAADDPLCALTGDILRDMSNLKWSVTREQFDKQTLPILSIYLTDGALQKLYSKRRETLDKPGQILVSEETDWVPASLFVDDGERSEKLTTELRLKGDWPDHISHPTKISFRIKVRKEGYVFGMKRFSIQHPRTRNYHAELMMMDEMRRWGVLAPRYRFVDVRINDYSIGVMALEEHFSKELLEAQNRREGPIVILDEDLMWRQRDLNMLSNTTGDPKAPGRNDAHIPMRDMAISQFGPPAYEPGATLSNNSVRGMSLYRDFMDGLLPPEDVFDLEKVAHWWVLMNTWYGCHGQAAHNRRFYFNPTTNLMEPIAFDNGPIPAQRTAQTENCDVMVAPFVLGNADFQRYVLDFAEQLLQSYQDPQWQEQFHQSQLALMDVLAMEDSPTKVIYARDLLRNLSYFLDHMTLGSAKYAVSDNTAEFVRKYPDAPLYTHVRAFLYPEGGKMTLQLKNLTADPLQDIQVRLTDAAGEQGVVKELAELPAYQQNNPQPLPPVHIVEMELDQPYSDDTRVAVQFQYRGQTFTEMATTQFRHHVTGFDRDFLKVLSSMPGVRIDKNASSIIFGPREHTIDHSLELGKGWSVTFEPGSSLHLQNGANLKIRGPLFALGSAEAPVRVHVSPAPEFRGIGAWGGILVSQAETRSQVQHAVFSGDTSTPIANRQDYYGITSCVTFYESDVDVVDSTFENMHCEDALNIVRADFTIVGSTIRGTAFDAFDSDFSTGLMRDTLFEATGNDGVDVSGTTLTLENVEFRNIGDKSVSVGEHSTLEARGLVIDGTSTGVASKDLSFARVTDSSFNNVRASALITYIKKSEYGSASIECKDCTFDNYTFLATNQNGSHIEINGTAQPVTNFNQQQLVEAGFAE